MYPFSATLNHILETIEDLEAFIYGKLLNVVCVESAVPEGLRVFSWFL
jgi:hypothetical protein